MMIMIFMIYHLHIYIIFIFPLAMVLTLVGIMRAASLAHIFWTELLSDLNSFRDTLSTNSSPSSPCLLRFLPDYIVFMESKLLWIMFASLFQLFSGGSAGKESACKVGDLGLIPGLGRCPGEWNGCPVWYSGLENSVDCIDHGVAKSRTRLSTFHFHFSLSSF